jgi:hypothetical protein
MTWRSLKRSGCAVQSTRTRPSQLPASSRATAPGRNDAAQLGRCGKDEVHRPHRLEGGAECRRAPANTGTSRASERLIHTLDGTHADQTLGLTTSQITRGTHRYSLRVLAPSVPGGGGQAGPLPWRWAGHCRDRAPSEGVTGHRGGPTGNASWQALQEKGLESCRDEPIGQRREAPPGPARERQSLADAF